MQPISEINRATRPYKSDETKARSCAPLIAWVRRGGNADRTRGKHRIPERAHPLVKKFFKILNEELATFTEVAERTGYDASIFRGWCTRASPQLLTFEACLQSLGYKLSITRVGLGRPQKNVG